MLTLTRQSEERDESITRINPAERRRGLDRKSTRLNSSHLVISYAVFCLKKKERRLTGFGDRGTGPAFHASGRHRALLGGVATRICRHRPLEDRSALPETERRVPLTPRSWHPASR